MAVDPRVQHLLDEILESGRNAEDVCSHCPELLSTVRLHLERFRKLESQVDSFFPPSKRAASDATSIEAGASFPRIPGYKMEAILGRGGVGIVYKAWHLRLSRAVAIKMLLSGNYAQHHDLERFHREAEAIAGLQHPNIVQVHDIGDHDGMPYFTMEFVNGGSLSQKLAGTPQAARQAASLVVTLGEAIQTAHQNGIVHRDLKPANVLLTSDGIPKITDFGLARRMSADDGLTIPGTALGTPSYMSPEQARGDLSGPPTDIYSLGAILYELLTGRPPFRAETVSETERQVIENEPAPPSRLNAKVPRDLETICLKCLEKDPAKRYSTAGDLVADLQRFLADEPIRARPVGPLERSFRWARRRPTAAALGGALLMSLILALALLGGWLRISGQHAAAQRAAEQDLQEVTRLEQKSDLAGARTALERAKGRLGAYQSGPLQHELNEAERNLDLATHLDALRLDRTALINRYIRLALSDRKYEEVFKNAGLGIPLRDNPSDVKARVIASPVSGALVAALDDWAACTSDAQRLNWLLTVARLADPDPWRDQVRAPSAWTDRAKLDQLVADVPLARQPLQLLVALGHQLQNNNNDVAALPYLHRLQQAYPTDYYPNIMLGSALVATGKLPEATGFLRAAVALRPDAANASCALGNALLEQGQVAEAISYFQRTNALNPTYGWNHARWGMALRRMGRTDDAISHLRVALRFDTESPFIQLNLALALIDKGQFDAAIEQDRAALRIDPDNSVAHYNLGATLLRVGRLNEALTEFREIVRLNPKDADAHYALGDTLKEEGYLDQALEEYQRALRLDPRNRSLPQEIQGLKVALGRGNEVRRSWQKNIAANLSQHTAWFGYAELCLFLGDEAEYHNACRQMLALFGDSADSDIAERTARSCLLLPASDEELRRAVAIIDRALAAREPKYEWAIPYFQFAKGLAEFRLNHFDRAIALMQGETAKVLGPCPGLVVAMAQYRSGQKDQARHTLATAVLSYDWRPVNAVSIDPWIAHVLRREAEAMILPNLPAFLNGTYQPRDNDERLALLGVCQFKDLRSAEAGLYAAAFDADPKLTDNHQDGLLYNAACSAAVAGGGGSSDGATLSEQDRARWREQARRWLRSDLEAWAATLQSAPKADRANARILLSKWKSDSQLASIRDAAALKTLPPEERSQSISLWTKVDTLVDQLRPPS
ncbi:MAG TPA: protein kinase [Phycisphaerae bacterium]|nr:protein kinase [Phycisphaerae bacterium]